MTSPQEAVKAITDIIPIVASSLLSNPNLTDLALHAFRTHLLAHSTLCLARPLHSQAQAQTTRPTHPLVTLTLICSPTSATSSILAHSLTHQRLSRSPYSIAPHIPAFSCLPPAHLPPLSHPSNPNQPTPPTPLQHQTRSLCNFAPSTALRCNINPQHLFAHSTSYHQHIHTLALRAYIVSILSLSRYSNTNSSLQILVLPHKLPRELPHRATHHTPILRLQAPGMGAKALLAKRTAKNQYAILWCGLTISSHVVAHLLETQRTSHQRIYSTYSHTFVPPCSPPPAHPLTRSLTSAAILTSSPTLVYFAHPRPCAPRPLIISQKLFYIQQR